MKREDVAGPQDGATGGDDLRATIEAAFEEVTQAEEAVPEAAEIAEVPTVETTDAETALDVPAPDAEEPAPQEPEIDPPQSWGAEYKDEFRNLPPKMKEIIAKREHQREAFLSQQMNEIAPFRKAIEQWTGYFSTLNVHPVAAIGELIEAEHALRSGTPGIKAQMLKKLAQDYGVDVRALAAEQANQPPPDPVLQRVAPYIQQQQELLRQQEARLRQVEQQRQAEMQAAQQARNHQVLSEIQAFASAKTEAGAPAHPHFDDVLEDIQVLAEIERRAGRTPDLKQLYDKAIYANPNTREKLFAAQRQAAEQKRIADERARAAKAAKAGASVSGSPTAAAVPHVDEDLGSTIRQSMREHGWL